MNTLTRCFILTIGVAIVFGQCIPTCLVHLDIDMQISVANGTAVTHRGRIYHFGGIRWAPWGIQTALGYVLDPTGGEKWTLLDSMPAPIMGKQFAVSVGDFIYAFPCASVTDNGAFHKYEASVFVFDPSAKSGSQWKEESNALPAGMTKCVAVSVGDMIYVSGSNRTIVTYNPNTKKTGTLQFFPNVTDYSFVSDTQRLYFVGGLLKGKWTQNFVSFDLESHKIEVLTNLNSAFNNIQAISSGPYIYILQWYSEHALTVNVWSNFTKEWGSSDITYSSSGKLIEYASAVYTGKETGDPQLFVMGGATRDTNGQVKELTNKVVDIHMGILIPTFSLVPDQPVAGQLLNVTAVGRTPESSYTLRISSSADCSSALPGIPDQIYQNTVTFTLPTHSNGTNRYLCFGPGSCPHGKPTQCLNIEEKSDLESSDNGQCQTSCCKLDTGSCVARTQNNSIYFSLSSAPFVIEPVGYVPVTPVPIVGQNNEIPKIIAIAVSALVVFLFAICSVRYYVLYLRPRPEMVVQISSASDQYEPISKLGSGSYGVVFLVRKKTDGKLYAMKYIPCADDIERDEAMKEFAVLRGFQGCKHMVRVTEIFMNWAEGEHKEPNVDEKTPLKDEIISKQLPRYVCIVMKYYEEGDLRRYIGSFKEDEQIPEEVIFSYIAQISSLLSVLHNTEPAVVHRDLKPENILLKNNRSQVVITDFGLARSVADTYCNTQAGSLPYVAPECWQRHYGTEVDMWAVGCIAYSMCSKRAEPNNTRVMFSDALRDPSGLIKDIREELLSKNYSERLADVTKSLLHLDYHSRPTSSELCETLADYCNFGDDIGSSHSATAPSRNSSIRYEAEFSVNSGTGRSFGDKLDKAVADKKVSIAVADKENPNPDPELP